jgi:hypothetical protein
MADASQERHLYDKKILKKHVRTGSTEGGACLNRHISGVTVSSCSHRWQAKMRASEPTDSGWYNWPAYDGAAPKGAWDVSASMSDKNFSESFSVPYVHNGHHILPNAVLNECIDEATTRDARLRDLVRIGLLDGKYNLNHKLNMIILPKERYVSDALKLPRHLHYNQMKHAAYSRKVKARVLEVIDAYQKQIKLENCKEAPDVDFDRKTLETISNTMRVAIRAWGVASAPRTLTAMTNRFIAQVTGWTT